MNYAYSLKQNCLSFLFKKDSPTKTKRTNNINQSYDSTP